MNKPKGFKNMIKEERVSKHNEEREDIETR
jgi:hypothetical protein